jgi:hypothetical protein
MKTLTLDLPDEVYSHLEIRSAIDDMRIKEGVEHMLIEMASAHKERRAIRFEDGKD